ncbi:hypothetical protein CW714_05225 [Methanophagales archaeon]|nr:MAG: hypothetical protein CW714_05225 [Methanophagales archaeon]
MRSIYIAHKDEDLRVYSVRDFLVSLLFHWLFNEDHPASGANYAAWTFVQLLMNAAQAKDYVGTVCGLDPGLPDADTLFGIRVCQPGLDTAVIQEGCEEADKKEVIHYRMRPMSHSTGR